MLTGTDKADLLELPSGAVVDLFDLDVHDCKSPDDAFELLQALQEKIIEIEFQLECHALGCMPNGESIRTGERSRIWEAKAKKALGWARIQKTDAQRRLQTMEKALNAAAKLARDQEIERAFMDVAKSRLDDATFCDFLDTALRRTGRIKDVA